MKEIYIIDGNYWMFSAYYATASMGNLMVNRDGVPTNAVYGFANMLNNVLKNNPTNVFVAFDAKGKSFRSEMLEVYKENRKTTPEELVCQFPIIREYLTAHSIPYLEVSGYEGDDVIGTVAKKAREEDFMVHIITSDKDMMQLIDAHTFTYKKNTKTKSLDQITPDVFIEKYGIQPVQMKDLLGLMGDAADNIPGVAGVGEKTAIKLLLEYGSIENIKENMDGIGGKLGEKIRDQIDMAILSKELATIKIDVPMDFTMMDTLYAGYDYATLSKFYRKYDMQSLLKRLKNTDTVFVEEQKTAIVSTLPIIENDCSISIGLLDDNYHKSPVVGFGFYNQSIQAFISLEDAMQDINFINYMKDDTKVKYVYDKKKFILACKWHGIEVCGIGFDLFLASYVLNPGLKDELTEVASYFDYETIPYHEHIYGKGAKKKIPEVDVLSVYLFQCAKAVFELKDEVIKQLKDKEQFSLYEEIELPIADILADMEFFGASIDIDVLKQLGNDFLQVIESLENEIYALAGEVFNISSPKQLGEILFGKLGLSGSKKTKTGYSTSVDVLQNLQSEHAIVEKVLAYRGISKLYSTYVVGLQEQMFSDGKVHTIYNQALTQTGRLSSIEPNLQNIPIRTEEGKLIRKAFVPSFDYLVAFDYSQIELRVLAHMANATSLIQAFNEGQDVHRYTASRMFQVPLDQVDDSMRRKAKAINFGIVYGISDFGLAKQVQIEVYEAKRFIQLYFEMYPEIKAYMDTSIDFCLEHGFAKTLLNRRRLIPEIYEKNFMRLEAAKRLAMNSPIQGTAADILKLAMIHVCQMMKENNLKSKMILQVHDELIFDVYKEELEQVMDIVQKGMKDALAMQVELKVDGGYAIDWFSLK